MDKFRIAFVSYEFPPETGGGGIGTYLYDAVHLLGLRGYKVFVFCAGNNDSVSKDGNVVTIRIKSESSISFSKDVVEPFNKYHQECPFDVLEGTDFDASGYYIKLSNPKIPYVVKLHTPRFKVEELNGSRVNFLTRIRMTLGGLRRLKPTSIKFLFKKDKLRRIEYANILIADRVASPSQFVFNEIAKSVKIEKQRVRIYPCPYLSNLKDFSSIKNSKRKKRILFVGRLEYRKGICDFIEVAKMLLKQDKEITVELVGRSSKCSKENLDYSEIVSRSLSDWIDRVVIHGQIHRERIFDLYRTSEVLLFLSHWESFGLVCLEAMDNGCVVVASKYTAAVEILNHGEYGLLVQPNDHVQIACSITNLLNNRLQIETYREKAFYRIKKFYSNPEIIIDEQVKDYQSIIFDLQRAY